MARFKSAVIKRVECPRCMEPYGVRIDADKHGESGTFICSGSEAWCGARVVYEINRGSTWVGVVTMSEQPSRFRRVPAE